MLLVFPKDQLTYHSVLLRLSRSSSTSGWRLCLSAVLRCLSAIPTRPPPGWTHQHPCQWQVLYRSYSRRQRRLSRRACKRRPSPSAVAQSVFHLFCNWLCTCSPLAAMNPHRPGGGHYRPRRRTAGELAKRAARAAARAAAAGPAGGAAAGPAAIAEDDAEDQAAAPAPKQVSVSAAPAGRGAVYLHLCLGLHFVLYCGPDFGNSTWTRSWRLPRSVAAPASEHCCWP